MPTSRNAAEKVPFGETKNASFCLSRTAKELPSLKLGSGDELALIQTVVVTKHNRIKKRANSMALIVFEKVEVGERDLCFKSIDVKIVS